MFCPLTSPFLSPRGAGGDVWRCVALCGAVWRCVALCWRHWGLPFVTVELVVFVDRHSPSLHGAAVYGEHSENVLFHHDS